MNIAVVTTFPNNSWNIYSKKMLESFVQYWPSSVPLMVQLDDDLLYPQVDKIVRSQDGIAVGQEAEHAAFVERNKDKDDPTNYRKQAVRFCHKVFAIHRAYEAAKKQKEAGGMSIRYLIWLDADVHTTRAVTEEEIKACLPKEGDAAAYLGRKDWEHSECGWLAFDLENGGDRYIEDFVRYYKPWKDDKEQSADVFYLEQWHDSWVFDNILDYMGKATNLTENKSGMDIWPHSPMGAWSTHYKGPQAKQALAMQPSSLKQKQSNIQIQTKNAIPNEEICQHIARNQELITNWVRGCELNDEEIVVVSAGPLLVAEDVREEKGKKIIAVKHAIEPLKKAGITPWAVILLDPRPHMLNFVKDPDPEVIWFVASQVNPKVTEQLLDVGCTVWGYHASVNANEHSLTSKQADAIIGGGSATATRGLYLLRHLGFHNLTLYGYELSFPDKPDLDLKDDMGQPRYLEISLGTENALYSVKKRFWTEPQLIAQFEEMKRVIEGKEFTIKAHGEGIVPFLVKIKNTTDLRLSELRGTMPKLPSYKRLIKWNKNKKTRFLTKLRLKLRNLLHRTIKKSKSLPGSLKPS